MKLNLSAAVIGSGYMGKKHLKILSELVEKVIVCSNDLEGGKALAEEYGCEFYSDYKELYNIESLDFVSICLPTHLHKAATVEALEKGINVLCEKPFAATLEEAEEMIAAAKRADKLLMIGHAVRFSRPYEYLKRCVADGRFGKLLYLDLWRHADIPIWSVGNWLTNLEKSGGAIKDLHIHDTDAIVNILGMPKSVKTVGGLTASSTIYGYVGIAVTASGSWRNAKGFPFFNGYDAIFENASLQMLGDEVTLHQNDLEEKPLEKENLGEIFESDESLDNEIYYFCHCLTKGLEPTICLPTHCLNTIVTNDAELDSLLKGKEVAVC